jgi:hypothetical protein
MNEEKQREADYLDGKLVLVRHVRPLRQHVAKAKVEPRLCGRPKQEERQ